MMEEFMQQQTDRFIALMVEGIIDVKDFYNVSITPTKIKLQGDAKSEAIYRYKEQGFNFSLDESCSMMEANKDDIRIVLTF
jgi:hypothetical protein